MIKVLVTAAGGNGRPTVECLLKEQLRGPRDGR
jgi:hypothetical protein